MTPNASATQLLTLLQAQHAALFRKMGTVTEPRMGMAILQESQEVLHRMNLVQNLVFIAVAQEVSDAVAAVAQADRQLTQELQAIASTADLVEKMSRYLGFVDQAIDLMKKFVVLA
jgi:hypothetical protein